MIASVVALGPSPTITSPRQGDAVTQAWVKVSGRGEPGKTLAVFDNGRHVSNANVKNDTTWSLDASFVTGEHSIQAAYEQVGGLYGTKSRPIEFVVKDLLKPLERRLEITNAKDGDKVPAGVFRLTGTTAPGRRIEVAVNDGKSFFKTAEEDGSWSFNLYLEKGPHIIDLQTAVEPREEISIILNAE